MEHEPHLSFHHLELLEAKQNFARVMAGNPLFNYILQENFDPRLMPDADFSSLMCEPLYFSGNDTDDRVHMRIALIETPETEPGIYEVMWREVFIYLGKARWPYTAFSQFNPDLLDYSRDMLKTSIDSEMDLRDQVLGPVNLFFQAWVSQIKSLDAQFNGLLRIDKSTGQLKIK